MLTLEEAKVIVAKGFEKAREMNLDPLCIAVLDEGGHVKVLERQDGASNMRVQIAIGKAWGSIGMGFSSRKMGERLGDRPAFLNALTTMAEGKVVPVPGGVLIARAGKVIGGVGISGASSDDDEACAVAGIKAAALDPII